MSRLQTLTLDGNYFNGTLPDWFGSLSNLTVLRIQRNRLKGSIPAAVGMSSELLESARYISQAVKFGSQIMPTHRAFSLDELKEATKCFERSAFLGEGSIGKLYKEN
ncbi:hypothetical protein ZWY2020_059729 [Hordeum vulgare]|nr:hypothetical protein ZWY2020_059729 [Hordeum vulgare]